jgi:tripartite-type tricarboxylate transporter receptor subunit TctC
MRHLSRLHAAALTLVALVSAPVAAQAQAQALDWPTRPVTVVMPYRAGGGGETLVRLVMQQLAQTTGHSFIIENRAGAAGTVGAGAVAKERPDGYTLLASGVGGSVVAPEFVKVSFDTMKDFTHIALLGGPPPALAVTASLPAKTLQQYIELSRSRPEGISFGSSGFGTHVHLMAELFKSITGANMLHVPYNGGGPAMTDLIAGHVPSAVVSLGTVSQYARAGTARLLAVASPKRVRDFPDVPTFAELGYPTMTSVTWFGLSAPAGLPREIAVKLNAEVRAAMRKPEVLEKLRAEAIEPNDMDPDAFTQFIRSEIERWTPLARKINASKPAKPN